MAGEIKYTAISGIVNNRITFQNSAGQYRRTDNGVYENGNAANVGLYGFSGGTETFTGSGEFVADYPLNTTPQQLTDTYFIYATATGTLAVSDMVQGGQNISFWEDQYVKPVNLIAILGTILTETAGYLAAGFKKWFNVATPVLTVAEALTATEQTQLAAASAGSGSGSNVQVVNVQDSVSSANLQGVTVIAFNGTTPVAEGVTDASGNVTLNLNSLTLNFGTQRTGYYNGLTTATVPGTINLKMVASTIPAFNQPGQARGYFLMVDGQGYFPNASTVVFTMTVGPTVPTTGGYDRIVSCQVNKLTGQPINPGACLPIPDTADGCVFVATATYVASFDGGPTSEAFVVPASGAFDIDIQVLGGF